MGATEAADPTVGPIGGQAFVEGVMMRRGTAWGAAVRRPDGTIVTTSRRLPEPGVLRRIPLVRGVFALYDTTLLGTRGTMWGAQARGASDGTSFHPVGLVATAVLAFVLVLGVFGLLPAVIVKAVGITNGLAFSVVEGLIRLGILVGYLFLLGRSAQVRRVFGYHGAEHMTIHAFEHRRPLDTASIRTFDRRHPRCGTAFLLVVVLVTVFAHALVGHPTWPVLIASRVLMAPGSWLQTITTAEPADEMIEVAVSALEATLAAERGELSPLGVAGVAGGAPA